MGESMLEMEKKPFLAIRIQVMVRADLSLFKAHKHPICDVGQGIDWEMP